MSPRILELADLHSDGLITEDESVLGYEFSLTSAAKFYREAHQDGQRAMRERVAKTVDWILKEGGGTEGDAIRNFEIE